MNGLNIFTQGLNPTSIQIQMNGLNPTLLDGGLEKENLAYKLVLKFIYIKRRKLKMVL